MFDPQRTSPTVLLKAIRDLGYAPTLVAAPPLPDRPRASVERIDPEALPGDLRSLFLAARRSATPVLIELWGPG